MPDTIEVSQPTRNEQELDALKKFRFTDLFTHTPPEGACMVCGRKHFNWGPACDTCRGVE